MDGLKEQAAMQGSSGSIDISAGNMGNLQLNRPANRDGVFAILHEGSEACNSPSAVSQKYFFDATLRLTTSAKGSHIVGTQELNS